MGDYIGFFVFGLCVSACVFLYSKDQLNRPMFKYQYRLTLLMASLSVVGMIGFTVLAALSVPVR